MNFRPTILKVVLSLVVGFILGSFLMIPFGVAFAPPLGASMTLYQIKKTLAFFLGMVIIYIVWSLIQSKSK